MEKIYNFHRNLPGYSATPLIRLKHLAKKTGVGSIDIKDESKRFGIQAFKSLGASWAMHSILTRSPGLHTFCTATDGNHGRAVAWSARIHNQKAIVYMPSYSVKSRVENIQKEGATVILVDGDYDLCVSKASEASKKNGFILIQDTSWKGYSRIPELITQGYYTQFFEILRESVTDKKETLFDIVFLQSGVGSWASSVSTFLNNIYGKRKPKIVIVEPNSADCILESAKNNKISKTKGNQDTIMAGLNCGTPSLIAFEILMRHADAFISVSDNFAKSALKILQSPLADDHNIESCETGAAGLAGFLAVQYSSDLSELKKFLNISEKSRVLLINTEGNTDPEMNSFIMGENLSMPWDQYHLNRL